MLPQRAITTYLERELACSETAKRFTEDALWRKIEKLDPQPDFFFPPRLHQLVCFLLGIKYEQYLFLLDMGLGKTKIVLDLFDWRWSRHEVDRMLVLVPNTCNLEQWGEEIEKHLPGIDYGLLDGTPQAKREMLLGDTSIIVATYATLLHQLCYKQTGVDKDGNPLKGFKRDEKKVREIGSCFDCVVYDEISVLKNNSNIQSTTFKALGNFIPYRYGLTGTPFGRDPQDLFGQFRQIDHGETLGRHLNIFRQAFFTQSKNFFGGYNYAFKKNMSDDLHRMIQHRSIRYSEDECLDLPERIEQVRHVIFAKETWDYYAKIVEELQQAKGEFNLLDSAFTRLRQLTAGFLVVKDSQDEKHEIVFKNNPKLDALVQLLSEVPGDRKAIVFHDYVKSGDLIEARLKKEKIKYVRLAGKGKKTAQSKFKTDPSVKVFLASTAAAFGLNLQVANYEFFFESPCDPTLKRQMIKRAHRDGQERVVFVTDIVVKGSYDENILENIAEGKNLHEAIVEGKTPPILDMSQIAHK